MYLGKRPSSEQGRYKSRWELDLWGREGGGGVVGAVGLHACPPTGEQMPRRNWFRLICGVLRAALSSPICSSL